jgi:hypothetical protein
MMELLWWLLVFEIWCFVQVLWFRRARVVAPARAPAPAPRTVPPRTIPPRRRMPAMPDRMSSVRGATAEFMAGLGYSEPATSTDSTDPADPTKGSGVLNVSADAHGRNADHPADSVYR